MLLKEQFTESSIGHLVTSSVLGFVLVFSGTCTLAQPVAIGRSSLTMPDPENWKIQDLESAGIGYSGDAKGAFALGAKRLTYFSPDKVVKATFVTKVTKGGVTGVMMTWPNTCPSVKQSGIVFKDDKGSFSAIDCLLVMRISRFEPFINALPNLKKDLVEVRPGTQGGYYIQYSKSIGAGGYAITEALLASDFKGLEGATLQNETTISPAVLSWGVAFAKSNSAAIGSMSGNWSMPSLVFNQQ